jgi:DNA-binding response OmpR family regulator
LASKLMITGTLCPYIGTFLSVITAIPGRLALGTGPAGSGLDDPQCLRRRKPGSPQRGIHARHCAQHHVGALGRRVPAAPPVTVRGDLVFDRARRKVSRAGRPLSLTRKELSVLEELLVADGGVVSTEELLERVWDENADPFTRTVTVTLARLRRKLGEPELIETVVGCGYRLS